MCVLHLLLYVFVPIRDIVFPIQFTRLLEIIQNRMPCSDVFKSLGIVIVIVLTVNTLDMASDYIDTILLPRLQSFVRSRALDTIITRHENDVQELGTGDIISRLIKLPSVITSVFERVSIFIIPQVVMHVSVFCNMLFNVDAFCAAYIAIATFAIYVISWWTTYGCNGIAVERDRAFAHLHEEIDDTMRNLYSIYGANEQSFELKRLGKEAEHYNELYGRTMLCSFKYRSLTYPIITLFLFVFMMRINFLSATKAFAPSKVSSTCWIAMILVTSFMNLDDQIKSIVYEVGVIQSNKDLISVPPSSSSLPKASVPAVIADFPSGYIGLSKVTYKYPGAEKPIIRDFDFHVRFGERVIVVGDIGIGKSTILKLLIRYAVPTSGHVYFDGTSISDMSTSELRRKIGYVPQSPILFNRTVLENMTYGIAQKPNESEITEFLKKHGIWHVFSDKLHRRIGKNGSSLSGGQRQLLWTTRVILSKPQIYLMDEWTANVDKNSKKLIIRMVEHELRSDPSKTLISVTHDPDILHMATRVFEMKSVT